MSQFSHSSFFCWWVTFLFCWWVTSLFRRCVIFCWFFLQYLILFETWVHLVGNERVYLRILICRYFIGRALIVHFRNSLNQLFFDFWQLNISPKSPASNSKTFFNFGQYGQSIAPVFGMRLLLFWTCRNHQIQFIQPRIIYFLLVCHIWEIYGRFLVLFIVVVLIIIIINFIEWVGQIWKLFLFFLGRFI